jgi:hypothetical protein
VRILALIRKPLVLLVALVALFAPGGPSTTHAAATAISPAPTTIYFRQGTWNDSGARLSAAIDKTSNHILITDDTVLCAGCVVRLDSEYMLIQRFEHGALHAPDTMVVLRGWYGSTRTAHGSGTVVKAQTATASIFANNVTDAWGLGAFTVVVGFPPETKYVKLTAEPAWLGSTGRMAMCDGFQYEGENIWQISCSTTGNPGDSGHPLGPKGSGLIASLIVQVGQSTGTSTVNIWGNLFNTTGAEIPATVTNLNVAVQECPDTNLDGKVDSGDIGQIARNFLDRGEDSGVTLVSQVDTAQTSMAISGQGLLVNGDTIAIDAEQMTIVTVQPDTMTVTRGANFTRIASHVAGASIYRGTIDGNGDGRKGYTRPRDVTDDNKIDSGDLGIVARTMVTQCPAP